MRSIFPVEFQPLSQTLIVFCCFFIRVPGPCVPEPDREEEEEEEEEED